LIYKSWTEGTYPVDNDQLYHQVDRTNVLPYYQWVPFILLFQASCFLFPNLIWHTFSRAAGIDVTLLGKHAEMVDNCEIDKREAIINEISRHIDISLSSKYDYSTMFKKFNIRAKLPFGRRHGNFLFIVYMIVKLMYTINIVCQLLLLDSFFGFRNYSFGVDFIQKFLIGKDYSRIDRAFPRFL
jgi:innexin